MFLLIGLQWVISTLTKKYRFFDKIIKAEPRMLFYKGEYLRDAMKKEMIVEGEILQSCRNSGVNCILSVETVVLENDGSINVIGKSEGKGDEVFSDVKM